MVAESGKRFIDVECFRFRWREEAVEDGEREWCNGKCR